MRFKTGLLLLVAVLFSATVVAQYLTPLVINSTGKALQSAAAGIDFNIGEAVTVPISNGTTQITQGFLQPDEIGSNTLKLKVYLQGYYAGNGMMRAVLMNQGKGSSNTETDTITVELRNSSDGSLVESSKALLMTNGMATADFPFKDGSSFYIAVRHRNTVETWSAHPIDINTTENYDFTESTGKAYGNNMAEVETGVFALFSGDLNQDGAIETTDYAMIENDVLTILFGYHDSDLNGDGVVETSDYTLMENNILRIIFAAKPF